MKNLLKIDKYYVASDDMNFIVQEKKITEKTEYYHNQTFHPTIESAIEECYDRILKDELKPVKDLTNLEELLTLLKDGREKFLNELIKKARKLGVEKTPKGKEEDNV